MSARPLIALLRAKSQMARHWVVSVRAQSRLKVAVVSVFTVALWLALFGGARLGLGLFEVFAADLLPGGELRLADLILGRLLSVFALTLLVLLALSNVLVAFATLYRAHDMPRLVLSPIPPMQLYLGRLAECAMASSWASAYLGSPLLLAYGLERGAPPMFYVALVLFFVPFVLLPAAFGATVAIVLVRLIAPRRDALRPSRLLLVGLALAVLFFGFLRPRLAAPDLTQTATLQAIVQAMAPTQSPLLPSQWLADGVLRAAAGDGAGALFLWLLLMANALAAVTLATLVAERWLLPSWSMLWGGGGSGSGGARGRAVGGGGAGGVERARGGGAAAGRRRGV
ncbi:MAG: hypothetical protein AAF772_12900, partial [Acidobacteriota bacterium]